MQTNAICASVPSQAVGVSPNLLGHYCNHGYFAAFFLVSRLVSVVFVGASHRSLTHEGRLMAGAEEVDTVVLCG